MILISELVSYQIQSLVLNTLENLGTDRSQRKTLTMHGELVVFVQPRPLGFSLKNPFFKGKALGTRLGFCSQFLLLFSHAKPTNLFIVCCRAARKSVTDLQIV